MTKTNTIAGRGRAVLGAAGLAVLATVAGTASAHAATPSRSPGEYTPAHALSSVGQMLPDQLSQVAQASRDAQANGASAGGGGSVELPVVGDVTGGVDLMQGIQTLL